MKIKTSKALKAIFDALKKEAYNRDFHNYDYKKTNLIVREHFERLEKINKKN